MIASGDPAICMHGTTEANLMTDDNAKQDSKVQASDIKPEVEHVILLVHGIESVGSWHQEAKEVLSKYKNVKVVSNKFGKFPFWKFLLPFDMCKKERKQLFDDYLEAKAKWKHAKISVIAHSYGTHILTQLLRREASFEVERIILCGAVIKQNFKWGLAASRIGNEDKEACFVVNDCGNSDAWLILGAKFGWHYGLTGIHGAGGVHVENRFHDGGHGLFFDKKFIRKYWVPFLLENGKIVNGNVRQNAKIPWYVKPIQITPAPILKSLIIALVCLPFLLYLYWPPKHNFIQAEKFFGHFDEVFINQKEDYYADSKITIFNTTILEPHYLGQENSHLIGIKDEEGLRAVAVLKNDTQEKISNKEWAFDVTGTISSNDISLPIIRECVFSKSLATKTTPK